MCFNAHVCKNSSPTFFRLLQARMLIIEEFLHTCALKHIIFGINREEFWVSQIN